MENLPTEILLEIIGFVAVRGPSHSCGTRCPVSSTLASLSATCRRLLMMCKPYLYKHDVLYGGRAVAEGARLGCLSAIIASHTWGADICRVGHLPLSGVPGNASGSALHIASHAGHLDVVQYLIRHGAEIDAACMNLCSCHHSDYPYSPAPPWTPLHLAMCQGHTQVAQYLIKNGADLVVSRPQSNPHGADMGPGRRYVRPLRGVHIVDEVAKHANLKILHFLQEYYKDSVGLREIVSRAADPLRYAACITGDPGRLQLIRALLDNGVRLDSESSRPFDKPLISWVKSYENADPSLSCANPEHPRAQLDSFVRGMSVGGNEPYLSALASRVVVLWLDRGSSSLESAWSVLYHALLSFGVPPVEGAVARKWAFGSVSDPKIEPLGPMSVTEALDLLPNIGFPLSVLEPIGDLFLEAANNGLVEECQWFLDHGVDVDSVSDRLGGTALHLAVRNGNAVLLHLLLSRGANRDAVDKFGNTVYSLARLYRRDNFIIQLRSNGSGGERLDLTEHNDTRQNDNRSRNDTAALDLSYGEMGDGV